MTNRIFKMTSIGALMASMAIVGCSRQEQADAKATTRNGVSQVEEKSREVGNDVSTGLEKAKVATQNTAQGAKETGKEVSSTISDKVADAVITTTLKAELAKDSSLSALKINVDTDNGRVALHGTAPSSDARARASALASGVKGVVSVDNQLNVDAAKK